MFIHRRCQKKSMAYYNFFFCKQLKRGNTHMFSLSLLWTFLIQNKQGTSVFCARQRQTQGPCSKSERYRPITGPAHTEAPVSGHCHGPSQPHVPACAGAAAQPAEVEASSLADTLPPTSRIISPYENRDTLLILILHSPAPHHIALTALSERD